MTCSNRNEINCALFAIIGMSELAVLAIASVLTSLDKLSTEQFLNYLVKPFISLNIVGMLGLIGKVIISSHKNK